jgi:Integrase core domain
MVIDFFVLFVDDCTRMTWLYLLKTKGEVASVIKSFYKLIKIQYGKEIRVLRSDNGGEFLNRELKDFFREKGIIHQTSCVNTPQQNGVTERKNRHILETTRALIIDNNVPNKFWEEAVTTVVYLINRMPSKTLNFKTPLQVLASFVHLPSILTLPPKIFGCKVYIHIHKNKRTKLDPCAEKCVFLGYGTNQKGYRCHNPITNRTYVTMDVDFLEDSHISIIMSFLLKGRVILSRKFYFLNHKFLSRKFLFLVLSRLTLTLLLVLSRKPLNYHKLKCHTLIYHKPTCHQLIYNLQ